MLYQKIEEEVAAERELSVRKLCQAVEVSRASYYRFRSRPARGQDMELRSLIQRIALGRRRHGYRRVPQELRQRGHQVNHKRVRRIMREDNFLCLRRPPFFRRPDPEHALAVYPNPARVLSLPYI